MLHAVRSFLTRYGESRFVDLEARAKDEDVGRTSRSVYNRAGWRLSQAGRQVFWIDADVFRDEVCAGFDHTHVCRVLAERRCLELGEEAGKQRYTLKRAIPGEVTTKRRVYIITSAIWDE